MTSQWYPAYARQPEPPSPVPATPDAGSRPQHGHTSHLPDAGQAHVNDSNEMPQFGATFVPGGQDDYFMPEVVAPSPQRVMPEVPQNMQEDLQRMELEANGIDARRDTSATSPTSDPYGGRHDRQPSLSTVLSQRAGGADENEFIPFNAARSVGSLSKEMDMPSFSPFPKVKGENIPPSDEEKEEILYNAREHVLHSNNVSMQLSWARDTLMWVEIAAEARVRESESRRSAPLEPTKVEAELRREAMNIVNYLASQDHPEATFMKAKWMEFGKFGEPQDKREAYKGYKKAADLGWGRAEYRMGMLFENSNDFEKAIMHYNLGLSRKDSAAQYRLGMMSLLGQHGYRKDYQKGLELIQKAADAADEDAPQGAYVYGMLIARDLPDITIPESILPLDLSIARQYIEKAAYQGFAKAQLKMGQAYELCQLGCDFNPSYSLHYYGLAARQGQPEAALGVSRWFLFGQEGFFAKNEQLAFKYAQQAADAKLATGEFAMGYYHEIGIHVPKDLREARNWYEKAAEHGNRDAVGRLESLNQAKTLTKQDHETTTLTRIKSQHGSQRGKRPERFSKPDHVMPTVTESESNTPITGTPPPLPAKGPSPRVSPGVSPHRKPVLADEGVDMPDPSRLSTMNSASSRPPAFTVKLDQSVPHRPKSAAPYPEDDRPAPLNLSRPTSTAPYPEDDVVGSRRPVSPHFNPSIRPSQGPQADRPMSAFGIRPLSPNSAAAQGSGGLRTSHSGPNLAPIPPAGTVPPRGRVVSTQGPPGAGWEPQVPSGYRQPSPGPAAGGRVGDYPHRQSSPQRQSGYGTPPPQRLSTGGPGTSAAVPPGGGAPPVGDPTRNRLQKQNPNLSKPHPGPPPGQFPMPGHVAQPGQVPPSVPSAAQPGRDYGPRTSSRPVSDNYDRYGGTSVAVRLPLAGSGRPERVDSLPVAGAQSHNRIPSAGGRPPKDRPAQMDIGGSGWQSAPPAQGPRTSVPGVGGPVGAGPSPVASVASTTAAPGHGGARHGKGGGSGDKHPDGKTMGQGPATFEEMGIPQGKNDDDCVVM